MDADGKIGGKSNGWWYILGVWISKEHLARIESGNDALLKAKDEILRVQAVRIEALEKERNDLLDRLLKWDEAKKTPVVVPAGEPDSWEAIMMKQIEDENAQSE